ncbi:MAG: polysaccharide deacetylase [Firmicutes bacterium HGW-Firmicutes-13]|nr:MAG: polysaccharide deacetylase [Firmicutes bacterium HGW-Firmicutes-13]
MKHRLICFVLAVILLCTLTAYISGCVQSTHDNLAPTVGPKEEEQGDSSAEGGKNGGVNHNGVGSNTNKGDDGSISGTDNDIKQDSKVFLSDSELLEVRPNELGEVMILMYHQIGEPEGEWTRTPENFRRDLEELYCRGYRLVSLLDFVQGEIDLPPGKTPVILTFDDGSRGQFNYLDGENGPELDPNSAVGILEDFYREYPDFGRAATFYIYYPLPFRQKDYIQKKLEFLRDNGYEIGNHSYTHANLSKISPADAIKELALNAGKTSEILPGYQVQSLALPYGAFPKDRILLAAGGYEGFVYRNEAVLLVGYRPAASPFSTNFDYQRLPRVRASETKVEGVGLYDWLKYFEVYPERRYISDGNLDLITIPEEYEYRLKLESVGEREVRTYSDE